MAEKMTRLAAVQATAAGGAAAREGKSAADCPHPTTAEPSYDDFMAHHWLKGYAAQARG